MPRICVSILPKTVTEALRSIEKAEDANADLIEVRLDCFKDYKRLTDVASHGKTLKIATCKLQNRNRAFSGTETKPQQLMFDAAKSGFEYVDVDLTRPKLNETVKELKQIGANVIVSFHDFAGTPSTAKLSCVLESERASGADVCKIVTTAKRLEDNLVVLNFTATSCKKTTLVCFAMHKLGKISRLLSPLFGGHFTFASLEHGSETATGQMTIQEMRTVYELLGQV